jgi:hypothetical protein
VALISTGPDNGPMSTIPSPRVSEVDHSPAWVLPADNTYHIETHSAPLTTMFLSIQDAPGMNPADLLGCLYLSIQIESVFLYGRATRIRTEVLHLKRVML